jgi:hypothetical protein
MTFKRTLLACLTVWVAGITLLHASLNWGLFEPGPSNRQARKKFKVGFLPVT